VASAIGAMVIDTVAPKSPQQAVAPGATQNLEWNLSGADYSGAGSSAPGAAVVSPSWTLATDAAWAMGAVAINPATVLADLSVTASGLTRVPATSNLTYSLTVANLGSATASNVVVSDVLPPGATFVSASGGGTYNAGVVTWPALTSVAPAAMTNYTVTITAPAFGTLTNIVYGTALTADPDPSNNNGTGTGGQVVTTVATRADVAATVTGPASVPALGDFSYTITVTNAGPSPATEVVVGDTLPAGVVFVSASDGGRCEAGLVTWPAVASLASGEAANFTLWITAPASGTLIDTVASASATSDSDMSNNDGSAPGAQVLTTVTPLADVATTVTGPTSGVTNAPFTYTVTVANLGPSDATGVVVSDTLPEGVGFVSASAGGTHSGGVVTWPPLAHLASQSITNLTVTVTVPVLGRVTNSAASAAITGDPESSNNDGSAVAARVVTDVYPFLVLSGQLLPDGGFQVEFHTYPDTLYWLLASTNLADWVTVITTNSGDGHVIVVDPGASSYPQRFYRSQQ
jgi:uncharacterized repeat protein (TIGR01451 family)